jgi:hypothetical protein
MFEGLSEQEQVVRIGVGSQLSFQFGLIYVDALQLMLS